MKAARTRCHPDFPGNAVTVDDDLAAVVELDLDNAIRRRLKIQIGILKDLLDMSQRRSGSLVEFGFV
jgi:hypothetical protein